ncbi:dihydrodipicolinate synthase family protein [Streptomyces puniciscabiei]
MPLPYSRGEAKERARSEWRGACNVTLPSYTPDFRALDERAIAHDIRHAADLGFWGTLVASESGTTDEEYAQFLEIAADAAPDGFRIVAHLSFSTVEKSLRAAQVAQSVGAEAALLSYPPSFVPRTAADIAEHTAYVAERTDLALILFAVNTWGFRPLAPQGFPPQALAEMVRLDTAVALKFESGGSAVVAAYADAVRRFGRDVLVEIPKEEYLPALVNGFGVSWIGTSGYESFGDRVPRVLDLLSRGKWEEGMEVFWSYQSAREAKAAFHAGFSGANLIHRNGWKYLSYLQGFNGGLLRMPQMRLLPNQMRALRTGLADSGFELPTDDSEFPVGRAASGSLR